MLGFSITPCLTTFFSGGIVAIYKSTRIPSLKSEDFSYDTSDLVIWTV
jgi:hypothetical protein